MKKMAILFLVTGLAQAQGLDWSKLDDSTKETIIRDYQTRYEDGRMSRAQIEQANPNAAKVLVERGVLGDPNDLTTWSLRELCLKKDQTTAWAEVLRRKLFSAKDQELVKQDEIGIGMSEDAMTCSLGRPQRVNRTVSAAGVRKQYIYGDVYVYTDNGIVTSWQD